MSTRAWRSCDENRLPASLRTGLGAEPVYSVRDDSWYVKRGGETLRYGLGTPADFDAAANDVASLVLAPIQDGDAALAAQKYDVAVAAYKSAASAGVFRVAPKIAAAGATQVTAPLLATASALATAVGAAPDVPSEAEAGAAGVQAAKMGELYSQACVDGKAALAPTPPPSPPAPPAPPAPAQASKPNYGPAILIGSAIGLGLIGWAIWPKR